MTGFAARDKGLGGHSRNADAPDPRRTRRRGGKRLARAMSDPTGVAAARISLPAPAIAAAILVVLIGLGVAIGGKVIAHQVVSGLLLGAIYMTVAVAFTLTIGVLNFLNFTIPTLFMLTGMAAWGLLSGGYLTLAGRGAWLAALAIGVAVAVIASLVVERFTFRYLKMKHGDATEHAIPLVSSLGFLIIFENLVLITLGSDSQRFAVPFAADLHVAGIVVGVPQLVSCVLAVAVVAALSFVLKRTKVGRALRTIAENPDTASLLGVDVGRVVPVVFILTGLLAGVAGALFTVNYGDVSPFMGDNVGTKAIAAMVLGGVGSIWGAIAGGLVVGLAETLSIQFFGGDSVAMTVWGLVLVIIVLRPKGLFGGAPIGKGKM
jgi:branched-chain amino acid transport system permease protein